MGLFKINTTFERIILPLEMILFSIFLLAGCGGSREAPSAGRDEQLWYMVLDQREDRPPVFYEPGDFVRLTAAAEEGASSGGEDRFRPWVDKIRPVEFHEIRGRYFVSVNRMGVAELVLPPPAAGSEPELEPPLEPELKFYPAGGFFARRTLGGSFVYRDQIVCQIYEDTVFSEPENPGGPALAVFSPESGGYSSIPLGLAPGWELVECLPGRDRWYLSLKTSGEEVGFSHFSYGPETRELEAISVEDYRRAFHPAPLAGAPGELKDLLACVPSGLAGTDGRTDAAGQDGKDGKIGVAGQNGAAGQVSLFRILGKRREMPAFFIAGSLEALRAGEETGREFLAREQGRWHLLDPRDSFLYTQGEGSPEIRSLPELPEGYGYTGFITAGPGGEWLVLSWEEQKFPYTGRAGLVFWKPGKTRKTSGF